MQNRNQTVTSLTDQEACKIIDTLKIVATKENILKNIAKIKAIHAITDRNEALAIAKKDGMLLMAMNPVFQNDYEVALAAVRQNHNAFLYASAQLKDHKGFVTWCLYEDPWIIVLDASGNCKKDPELLNIATRKNPDIFNLLADFQKGILRKYFEKTHRSIFEMNSLFNRPQLKASEFTPSTTLPAQCKAR